MRDKRFYSVNLEDHVPADQLLRAIKRCLDLGKLRTHLRAIKATRAGLRLTQRAWGCCYGIRAERRLCAEVHPNLAYRWFCRLGLEDAVPDRSTFSKNRRGRFRESAAFGLVFDEVVGTCLRAGLIKAEHIAVDASVVSAEALDRRYRLQHCGDARVAGDRQGDRAARADVGDD